MIAKVIARTTKGKRFGGLVAYVNDQEKMAAIEGGWGALSAYVLDEMGEGAKVQPGSTRLTNCVADNLEEAIIEIENTQDRCKNSTVDKTFHMVISFPPGETPTRAQLEDIEDELVKSLGFAEHQRLSAVHTDKVHLHIHVGISKCHPVSFRNVTPHRDHPKLMAACERMEIKHDLTRTHNAEVEKEGAFLAWVKEHAVLDLLAARDNERGWQDVHAAAAKHGLTVKLRGAGLVIAHANDTRQHVKASSADRGLSFAAMTDRLGEFRAPESEATQDSEPGMAKAPYVKREQQGGLYQDFLREKVIAERARKTAMDALKARHAAYYVELRDYYRHRLQMERLTRTRGILRKENFDHIVTQRQRDHFTRKAWEQEERLEAKANTPVQTWQAWLEAKAAAGSTEALKVLRGRQSKAASLDADVLASSDPDSVRHTLKKHLRPAIRRNGNAIYTIPGGGLVVDESDHVRVAKPTDAATLLALTLASERFGSKPLVVRGSAEFRDLVASLAGRKDISVTFEDRDLERLRKRAANRSKSDISHSAERSDGIQVIADKRRSQGAER